MEFQAGLSGTHVGVADQWFGVRLILIGVLAIHPYEEALKQPSAPHSIRQPPADAIGSEADERWCEALEAGFVTDNNNSPFCPIPDVRLWGDWRLIHGWQHIALDERRQIAVQTTIDIELDTRVVIGE